MSNKRSKPPYLADAVANEFIRLAGFGTITPMKIQKLVYYAHAWNLTYFDEPLVRDRIEAWTYGPVIRTLYDEFKEFRANPINRFANEFLGGKEQPIFIPKEDARSKALVEIVWDELGVLTPTQLSNLSHSPDEPWAKIAEKNMGYAITDELIKECFAAKLKKNG